MIRSSVIRTSHVRNAEHAGMADLLHATLVGVEGPGARHRA